MVSDMITPGYYNNKNTLFSQPKSETKAEKTAFAEEAAPQRITLLHFLQESRQRLLP